MTQICSLSQEHGQTLLQVAISLADILHQNWQISINLHIDMLQGYAQSRDLEYHTVTEVAFSVIAPLK